MAIKISGDTVIDDSKNWTGNRNIPKDADKTTSYTLQTADVGKVVGVGSGGSVTIPNSTFSSGDVVLIYNNTSSSITITCSTSTSYIAGTNANRTSVVLSPYGIANILFVSGTFSVITGNVL